MRSYQVSPARIARKPCRALTVLEWESLAIRYGGLKVALADLVLGFPKTVGTTWAQANSLRLALQKVTFAGFKLDLLPLMRGNIVHDPRSNTPGLGFFTDRGGDTNWSSFALPREAFVGPPLALDGWAEIGRRVAWIGGEAFWIGSELQTAPSKARPLASKFFAVANSVYRVRNHLVAVAQRQHPENPDMGRLFFARRSEVCPV